MSDGRAPACAGGTEVYSRVTGFYRPVQAWNAGKAAEFGERRLFRVPAAARPDGAVAGVRVGAQLAVGVAVDEQRRVWVTLVRPCPLDPDRPHRDRRTPAHARGLARYLRAAAGEARDYPLIDLTHRGALGCAVLFRPELSRELARALDAMAALAEEVRRG